MNDVDAYLRELERRLPRTRLGHRFLAEAVAHLREAATEFGEEEAVRRFGAVDEVAARIRAEVSARAQRLGAGVVLAACAGFVVPLYGVPENVLPPAPWASGAMPHHLEWKRDAIVGLLIAAVALSGAGAFSALANRLREAAALAAAAVAAAAAGAVLSIVLALQWAEAVPAVDLAKLLGLALPFELVLLSASTAALVVPRRLAA